MFNYKTLCERKTVQVGKLQIKKASTQLLENVQVSNKHRIFKSKFSRLFHNMTNFRLFLLVLDCIP